MVFVAAPLLSCVQLFGTPWTAACQAFLSFNKCPRAHLNSCTLSWWCNPTILSSVVPFSSCFQPFPASGSFPMGQFFTSGGQSIGASASASVLPMTIRGWFPLGLTDLISLQFKGLSRVFSNTTVQKALIFWCEAFFMVQRSHPWGRKELDMAERLSLTASLTSMHDYRKNHTFDYTDLCWQSNDFAF